MIYIYSMYDNQVPAQMEFLIIIFFLCQAKDIDMNISFVVD